MKTPISFRKPNLLFNSLMLFSGLTFMLVWLPLLRCLFDGSSYSWGQDYFGWSLQSSGLSADYFVLVLFLALYIGFYLSFYWIKNRVIFYLFLFWWWLHNFGNLLYDLIRNGDTEFHGETLNVHISLSAVVVPLAILAMILLILVIRKDRSLPESYIPWGRRNRIWLMIILVPLALQAILFSTGEPHDITDQIGVFIAIAQSFLFPLIFFPRKDPTRPRD